MTNLSGFTEAVLRDAPRFSLDDKFRFRCHPGVPCFNQCCRDVNIFLTPYDVLRLKNALGMTSEEFLERHTLLPFSKEQTLPTPVLRMEENEQKSCPFVTAEGCGVYNDRPWACRMYPLGLASPRDDRPGGGWASEAPGEGDREFYFVLQEDVCRGFEEEREWTVGQWLRDQDVGPYNEMGERFKELTLQDRFLQGEPLDPKQMEMFHTAVFDLDKFRRFVFESSFLQRFEVAEKQSETMRSDDEELLRFAFDWLKFCLLGQKTMKLKPEAANAQSPPSTSRP
ncbi:MAG: hypothetical protein COZ06_28965 [Armatimonadetes bacterium CG_4_10_14_3_um_filter_66_18]|nr:YkgJ family cysteine cluster protein [Armatimonadota bacterium]OIO93143.1 MAG: hypothetical protein AUJ96_30885 [Armatimonadetes bacterium CG2_30_66_41]PIU88843.1 MAG: hypothetical protein COS65_29965 [Armatimonadetes bacterium CG06_land_8_20_14_3_00_66_21]PIX48370.1 MAG: hypothetical protein COZ57_05695 [Armatimonadetes bacterium CG_4_8_14_3_um_filter_66_20]PIY39886.1 MAG: hypothetical protein COZ06_28965 [Armatimonadetes bacterium CG_4_10_14_3_um_filter_66_18]PIZ45623.1 MAG: hypothetical 